MVYKWIKKASYNYSTPDKQFKKALRFKIFIENHY